VDDLLFIPKGESNQYETDISVNISQDFRETVVPNTPEDYVKIFTGK
jgi:hypothetical protein